MACVTAQFHPVVIRDVMRFSKVVPWDWILDVEMPGDALKFYDARIQDRMSNPGQREADTWSGPEENPKTQYGRLGGVYGFAMSALGSRTCADVVAGTALPDVRR